MSTAKTARFIKQARQTAKDKAMALAEKLGKPTSTGIMSGVGLGTILAAAGALSRAGESDPSILSNPLLLGALGAAGGYLAGNAFEKAPAKRDRKSLSWTALAGLIGGTGALGAQMSKADAEDILANANGVKTHFETLSKGVPTNYHPEDGWLEYRPDLKVVRHKGKTSLVPSNLTPEEAKTFTEARKAYGDALRRAGQEDAAHALGLWRRGTKTGISDWWRVSNTSPKNILGALNPLKFMRKAVPPVSGAPGIPAVTARESLRRAGAQIADLFTNRRTKIPARLAALALLAGGGKAIYDKVSD